MALRDWRQALNSTPTYRIGNSTVRFQAKFVTVIAILGALVLVFLYGISLHDTELTSLIEKSTVKRCEVVKVNNTYPLSPPQYSSEGVKYRIGIISDLDKNSKNILKPNSWISYYLKGYLTWNSLSRQISLEWSEPIILKSSYALSGRGMELSELVVYNGKLLTFDDRTGIIYTLINETAVPWIIVMEGDGKETKGFKAEWATVKDNKLYIGSIGKEWTSDIGEFENNNPLWIKIITADGAITHVDWSENYKKLRRTVGIEFPGYMIHEAAAWSSIHKRWFFLPRRASKDRYNDVVDERKGTNLLLITDDTFDKIMVRYIGHVIPTRGYSSFKFVPKTNDEVIIALKSEENNGTFATYITSFTIYGDILLPEKKIADQKYEGLEFV